MKYFFFLTFSFLMFIGNSQTSLNDYKYVIVPKQFSAFKKENQHQTSTLVKFLLVKEGFNAVYDDNLPEDLKFNRCLGLTTDMIDRSTMFSTKAVISLKDCNNVEVFITREGVSKEKEYKPAYSEALREAMQSFKGVTYKYNEPVEEEKPITVSFKNDVKQLATDKKKPVFNKYQDPMVKQKATPTEQSFEKKEAVESNLQEPIIVVKGVKKNTLITTLYAQGIANGYQLVDSTPKIRFKIFKSSMPQIFHATSIDSNTSGIVYKKEDKWVFEYCENGTVLIQDLNIKF